MQWKVDDMKTASYFDQILPTWLKQSDKTLGFLLLLKKMQSSTQGYIFQSKNIDSKNVLCSLSTALLEF